MQQSLPAQQRNAMLHRRSGSYHRHWEEMEMEMATAIVLLLVNQGKRTGMATGTTTMILLLLPRILATCGSNKSPSSIIIITTPTLLLSGKQGAEEEPAATIAMIMTVPASHLRSTRPFSLTHTHSLATFWRFSIAGAANRHRRRRGRRRVMHPPRPSSALGKS